MSLQLIIGSAGVGKSYFSYEHILKEAAADPGRFYYVIVPEQFTMQTQKTLVELSAAGGILNVDVLSFERLAYRIFEEVGGDSRKLLEETGKSMVLQKIAQKNRKNLPYLGGQMNRPGYLDEVKSLLSEFMQYDISVRELEEMQSRTGERSLLEMKLRDVSVLYQGFRDYLKDHYMTGEEVMDALLRQLPQSRRILDSVVLLDGFTGFTPIQVNVVRELLSLCRRVSVTVTMDAGENPYARGKSHQLFYMSRRMIHTLTELTRDVEEPVLLSGHERSRFANASALQFLEQHLFRYHRAVYDKPQEEIQIYNAPNPLQEMEEAARRIHRLVREKGYRYGEIAVITGNLEEYGNLARQVFEQAGIPYFLDEKHTVMMNPFVEFLRAALEMAVKGFSYETVFRFLRCGMSSLQREEIDLLENYVLALGIRGFSAWDQVWVRIYRGMPPEAITRINEIRERFVEEIRPLARGFSSGNQTVREFCRLLYQFTVDNEIQQKLKKQELKFQAMGNKAMEKEYAQIFGIVMELLDRMAEILGEESISPRDYRQLLETGLSEAKVALIPPSMDQVQVGDMERTRLKEIKALFFVGVNEGNIPKNTQSGGILTEMDREFLEEQGMELAPGPKELMSIQRFYLYLNLTKPGRLLCLSYSRSNTKGEAVSPAYLIGSICAMFPRLVVEDVWAQPEKLKEEQLLAQLELPGTSLSLFLQGLSHAVEGEEGTVFAELYSWYLQNPSYAPVVKRLVQAAFHRNPKDVISKAVAKALYGEVSPRSATRLERFSACAFAHFLQYGLQVAERAQYEFRPMDMGNVMHMALEQFAREVPAAGYTWKTLPQEAREAILDKCLQDVTADYGNTILKSSARNTYMIQRTRRILQRTVWALQEQLKNGEFVPEGFEVSFGGGRIDRVDILEESDKVYVRVIDYKTGNTSFDLVSLYHGLQLQLMIYLDSALEIEKRKFPQKEMIPAGVFYYNVKDPMIQEKISADVDGVRQKILKELKMNGLVQADPQVIRKMDDTLASLPVACNKDGSFRKGSSIATREQFDMLHSYVQNKIDNIQKAIMEGEAEAAPYELGKKNACSFCPYASVCGFDRKLPGYAFRRLAAYDEDALWKSIGEEVREDGHEVD